MLEGMNEGWRRSVDRLARHLARALKGILEEGRKMGAATNLVTEPKERVLVIERISTLLASWSLSAGPSRNIWRS
jgi:hypothetical protein